MVVSAAAITPLPQAPEVVFGLLDLHGDVIAVINLRKRFRLSEREIRSEDQFIIARTSKRLLALVVDGTESVMERRDLAVIAPDQILAGTEFLEGVTRTEGGLVLIHDLESLLFAEEEEILAMRMDQVTR
jgi:purine-binding chemotaxis protein CheW